MKPKNTNHLNARNYPPWGLGWRGVKAIALSTRRASVVIETVELKDGNPPFGVEAIRAGIMHGRIAARWRDETVDLRPQIRLTHLVGLPGASQRPSLEPFPDKSQCTKSQHKISYGNSVAHAHKRLLCCNGWWCENPNLTAKEPGTLAHLTSPANLCNSAVVPEGMEGQSSDYIAVSAPVSTRFFCARQQQFNGGEGGEYKTRKGNKPTRLCTSFEPPRRLAGMCQSVPARLIKVSHRSAS